MTQSSGAAFVTDSTPYTGHCDSIEDIQWSPTEKDVFVTASADKTIKVWDVRAGKKAQMSITAHTSDVNVISWNRYGLSNFIIVIVK